MADSFIGEEIIDKLLLAKFIFLYLLVLEIQGQAITTELTYDSYRKNIFFENSSEYIYIYDHCMIILYK